MRRKWTFLEMLLRTCPKILCKNWRLWVEIWTTRIFSDGCGRKSTPRIIKRFIFQDRTVTVGFMKQLSSKLKIRTSYWKPEVFRRFPISCISFHSYFIITSHQEALMWRQVGKPQKNFFPQFRFYQFGCKITTIKLSGICTTRHDHYFLWKCFR